VVAAERARRNRDLGEGRSGQPGRDPTLGGRHGLLDADGNPLKIHRSRIRTTFQSLRDKRSWAGRGRATIDPNHSPPVEGDHYLTATTPSQRRAAEAIVEHARHDLPRKAHPPTVVTDTDAATLARDYPQLVASLALDDTVISELVGGQRDVFTAACADQLAGLHGPKGKPGPASPARPDPRRAHRTPPRHRLPPRQGSLVPHLPREGLATEGPLLGVHLGMSGKIVIADADGTEIDGGDYWEGRRTPGDAASSCCRAPAAGPDPPRPPLDLGPDAVTVTDEQFHATTAPGITPIKARLLDQQALAGIVNLLADEIL
jgi:hypothetical protein